MTGRLAKYAPANPWMNGRPGRPSFAAIRTSPGTRLSLRLVHHLAAMYFNCGLAGAEFVYAEFHHSRFQAKLYPFHASFSIFHSLFPRRMELWEPLAFGIQAALVADLVAFLIVFGKLR